MVLKTRTELRAWLGFPSQGFKSISRDVIPTSVVTFVFAFQCALVNNLDLSIGGKMGLEFEEGIRGLN